MSDQPAPPPPQPAPDAPDTEPDTEPDDDDARAQRGGPSSHDTAGQFPADEVNPPEG